MSEGVQGVRVKYEREGKGARCMMGEKGYKEVRC